MNNGPLSYASLKATDKSITPLTVTLAQVASNFETWESTLVKTGPAALSGGTAGTYAGNVTMNDGGSLVLYTASGPSFTSLLYPATVSSVSGYLTQFRTLPELFFIPI